MKMEKNRRKDEKKRRDFIVDWHSKRQPTVPGTAPAGQKTNGRERMVGSNRMIGQCDSYYHRLLIDLLVVVVVRRPSSSKLTRIVRYKQNELQQRPLRIDLFRTIILTLRQQ